jgi:heme/copper-type cytochrome/quinol oxidase subunit 2
MAQNMSASGRLASEQVVVAAPMSFSGSAKRIWKMTDQENQWVRYLLMVVAAILIVMAWCVVVCWYLFFGLLIVPYRLIRRGSRKEKKRALQHREQLEALASIQTAQAVQTANLIQQNQSKQQP